MNIKFNKKSIVKDKIKACVSYSLDNRLDHKNSITIHATDYSQLLRKIFPDEYEISSLFNDTGTATIFENHPLYAEARQKIEQFK